MKVRCRLREATQNVKWKRAFSQGASQFFPSSSFSSTPRPSLCRPHLNSEIILGSKGLAGGLRLSRDTIIKVHKGRVEYVEKGECGGGLGREQLLCLWAPKTLAPHCLGDAIDLEIDGRKKLSNLVKFRSTRSIDCNVTRLLDDVTDRNYGRKTS